MIAKSSFLLQIFAVRDDTTSFYTTFPATTFGEHFLICTLVSPSIFTTILKPTSKSTTAHSYCRGNDSNSHMHPIARMISRFSNLKTISNRICALPPELYNEILECTLSAYQHRIEQLLSSSRLDIISRWCDPRVSLHDIKVASLVHHLASLVETSQLGDWNYARKIRQLVGIFTVHPTATRTFLQGLGTAPRESSLQTFEVRRMISLAEDWCTLPHPTIPAFYLPRDTNFYDKQPRLSPPLSPRMPRMVSDIYGISTHDEW